MRKLILITGSLVFAQIISAQTLVTSSGLTPTQYVQNVLLGAGVTASNVTYTGYNNALGEFSVSGAPNTLGIGNGLVLTTGTVLNNDPNGPGPHGPNVLGSCGFDNLAAGDNDLDVLGGMNGSFNAAILEFDFIPSSDTVKFDFVFGSDEYMEFVDLGVSDAFGFFLSGPGLSGPYANSAVNIALVPGTNTPITIDSLNSGDHGAYYVDNEFPPGNLLEYDGHTTVLTAMSAVQCNQTYHIKIAISDIGDGVWDSGVFLKAGSFTSAGGVNISSNVTWSTNDTVLYEGCNGAEVTFVRFGDISSAANMTYTLTGTATTGTDYTGLNGTLNFGAGQDSITIPVTAIADGIPEGLETITITVTNASLCGGSTTSVYTFYITEPPPVTVDAGPDQTLDCTTLQSGASLTAVGNGGIAPLAYQWLGGPASASTTVFTAGYHFVTCTDFCGQSATDSLNITVIGANPIAVVASNDTLVCQGSLVTLTSQAIGGNGGIVYTWSDGSHSQNLSVIPPNDITYTVTVSDACGLTASESVIVDVDPVNASFINGFTAVDGEVAFANQSIPVGSAYLWNFGDGTTSTDQDPANHVYTVAGTYTITLTVTNPNGCVDSTSHVVVIHGDTYIYIPNTFTPGNVDGLNDIFQVYGMGFSNATLKIFNRWGQELYTDAELPLTWNGLNQNKVLYPQGVYVYRVEYKDGQGKGKLLIGHVNLIR